MSRLVFCSSLAALTALLTAAAWSADRPRTGRANRQRTAQPPVEEPADDLLGGVAAFEADEETPAADKARPRQTRSARVREPKAKDDKSKDKPLRQVQRGILQQMRNKDPEVRVAAVERLADYPSPEAARLLVEQGLASEYEDVRAAAYETLLSYKENEEVTASFLTQAEKEIKRGVPRDETGTMLAVALASHTAATEERALRVLDSAVAQPKGGLLLVVTLADALGAEASPSSLATLVKISRRPIFDEQFAVRRSVVQALTKIEETDAIDALVNLLAKAQGEVRGDIVRHLTAISGEHFGLDAEAWADWWKQNKDNFDFPGAAARAANLAEPVRSMSSYYGMPIYAARLVFVLDTSRSMMQHGRILAAKRELTSAINGLPEGVHFGVLAFSARVIPWQRQLVLASPENKSRAVAFVERQELGHNTASYDALEAAFDYDTEAVFFLTDGAPRGGKVVDPDEIVDVVTRLNRTRRVTVNSIGVAVGPPGLANPFDTFLKTLSERNYGDYRRVDE